MSERTVTTQAELDKALADRVNYVYIQSAEGVWITLRDSGSSHVVAWDSAHRQSRRRQDCPDASPYASSHVRDHDARCRSGSPRRTDRGKARRPSNNDPLRPSEEQPRPARELPARGVHERSDRLDRHADALATLAGLFRRALIKGAG